MSNHITDAEYEQAADTKHAAGESDALERSDAAKIAAVAALAEKWAGADGEPATADALDALTTVNRLGTQLRAALSDPDTVLAAVRAEALRERRDDVATRIVKAIEEAREQYTVLGDNPVGTTIRGAFNIAIQAALEAIRAEAVSKS